MRDIRLHKQTPKTKKGDNWFLTRGMQMRFVDKAPEVSGANSNYKSFTFSFDAPFNEYASIWSTTFPMITREDLRMIYEIEKAK